MFNLRRADGAANDTRMSGSLPLNPSLIMRAAAMMVAASYCAGEIVRAGSRDDTVEREARRRGMNRSKFFPLHADRAVR